MSDSIFYAVGIVAALIGIVILAWAMFVDRSRGRRRCPQCWYDMSATDGRRCPECGREPNREEHLFKTRRRWKWVMAGVVVIASGAFLISKPWLTTKAVAARLPTSVLITVFDVTGSEWSFAAICSRIGFSRTFVVDESGLRMPSARRSALTKEQWSRFRSLLIEAVTQNGSPGVRVSSMMILQSYDLMGPDIGPAIVSALHDGHRAVQYRALEMLMHESVRETLSDPNTLQNVLSLTIHSDLAISAGALIAAAQADPLPNNVFESIVGFVQSEDHRLRPYALRAIGHAKAAADRAYPVLMSFIDDPDLGVIAMRSLTKLQWNEAEVFEALVNRLNSENTVIRCGAIECLSYMDRFANRSIPLLEPFLADEDETTRIHASVSIDHLRERRVAE